VVILWILASVVSHLVAAGRVLLSDQRPARVVYSFGFPAMQMVDSTGTVVGGGGPGPGEPGHTVPGGGPGDGGSITVTCTDDPTTKEFDCQTCGFIPDALRKYLVQHGWPVDAICKLLFILAICYTIKLLIQSLLDWVCSSEWIRDKSVRRKCKKKRCRKWCFCCNKWFCGILVIVQWILQNICRWVELLSWLVFAACVIAGLVILFA
jgi:hypothetical protein